MRHAGLILLVLLLFQGSGFAQFGKNKVQYKNFEWYFIQSTHFDVYFYQDGDFLAEYVANNAEEDLASIEKDFRYQITNRIPIIVYNSHNDWQQTNVVSEYLEEGVGGVTELFKNRVVVPFEGNYGQFRHVIHHELVHAVINDMFYGGSIQSIITNNIQLQLPMWFNEGIAEYESSRWETNSDMFMRDITIHNSLPPIPYLNGYLAYRGGQSLWWYIACKYGDQKIGEIINRVRGLKNVEQGFKSSLGLSMEELNERWQKEQKVLYWPDIAKREEPSSFSKRMTNHVKDGNFYNTSPAISPQGDRIAFLSDRDDYFDIYLMSAIDGEVIKKVVSGQQSKNFEELKLLTPGISWSPEGKRIALATKAGESDAIIVIDVDSGEEEKIEVPLDGIFTVRWSPKGDKLAFIGQTSVQSDVYIYNLKTKEVKNLTDDIFSDIDPTFSPDGKKIYFASAHGSYLSSKDLPPDFKMSKFVEGTHNIFSIDIDTGTIERVTTARDADETSPVLSADGKKMLFLSTRNGINNIYEKDLVTGKERPLTNSLSGIYQLSLSADGNKLAFASLTEVGFDIFLMKAPFDRDLKTDSLEITEWLRRSAADSAPLTQHAAVKNTTSVKSQPDSTSQLYGKNIKIDFKNYVFADHFQTDSSKSQSKRSEVFSLINNVDSSGRYKVNKYKLNFSPDVVYGNAGYTSFYGVQGSTQMLFSDMLGDHQIYFATNLLIDLKNSDFILAYTSLKNRLDYSIVGFHSARFLYMDATDGYTDLFRFMTYGGSLSLQFPTTRFNRFDLGLTWLTVTKDNLDEPGYDQESQSILFPTLMYSHDTALWGYTAPINGERYYISMEASPKLNSSSIGFVKFDIDARKYFRLGRDFNFVVRGSGGTSFGPDPQRYYTGGTENWIDPQYGYTGIPIRDAADFVFLTPVLPMRGFDLGERVGTHAALANIELRFPFIRYFIPSFLPLAMQNITGTLFTDIGSVWTNSNEFKGIGKDANGNEVTQDIMMGTGFGLRFYMLGFLLRLDIAWRYDLHNFYSPFYYVSIGPDF